MTRKKYINNLIRLAIAIYRHPNSVYPENYKIGNSLRDIRRKGAQSAIKNFGSYDKAWNNEAIVFTRKFYGLE